MIARTKLEVYAGSGRCIQRIAWHGKKRCCCSSNDMASSRSMVTGQIEANGDAAAEYDVELLHEMSLAVMRVPGKPQPDVRRLSDVFSHVESISAGFYCLALATVELSDADEEKKAVRHLRTSLNSLLRLAGGA